MKRGRKNAMKRKAAMKSVRRGSKRPMKSMKRKSRKKSKSVKRRSAMKKKTVTGSTKMRERIVRFEKSKISGKKYMATVQNLKTKKSHVIHFGAKGYVQYLDRTPLKAFKSWDHLDKKRQKNYYARHSGGQSDRGKAIRKEIRAAGGRYNAKILSHKYLW